MFSLCVLIVVMKTRALIYTAFVIVALYLFSNAPVARGGETAQNSFKTCKDLNHLGTKENSQTQFSQLGDEIAKSAHDVDVSACGGREERDVNLVEPAGQMNADYDFFTGQKEVRID